MFENYLLEEILMVIVAVRRFQTLFTLKSFRLKAVITTLDLTTLQFTFPP